MKEFLKQSALFVLIGLLIYAGVYYGSEQLVYKYAKRNRFYTVEMANQDGYDYVILGASHALPLGFEDANDRLQEITGARIINLSTPGGGLVPNRLLLEYLLTKCKAKSVVYFLDSFAFYSREWNEDRLKDVRLFRRAPLDPDLAKLLIAYNFSGQIGLGVTLDYISGFSKINNPDRFRPDVSEDELTRFRRVHRPSSRDIKRVEYLYPASIDEQTFNKYLATFRDLIRNLKSRDIQLIVIRPPIPKRFYDMIPNEAEFYRRIEDFLAGEQVRSYNFALVDNDEKYFFDSDHLNRNGVMNFFDRHLTQVLARHRRVD